MNVLFYFWQKEFLLFTLVHFRNCASNLDFNQYFYFDQSISLQKYPYFYLGTQREYLKPGKSQNWGEENAQLFSTARRASQVHEALITPWLIYPVTSHITV